MRAAVVTAVALLALTACGGGKPAAPTPSAARTLTIGGQLEMVSGSIDTGPCVPAGAGYADIRQGTQVTVTDEGGKVVGLGTLGAGFTTGALKCLLPFIVQRVPAGHPFYGVEVAHRGVVRYTAAQVADQVTLTLGS